MSGCNVSLAESKHTSISLEGYFLLVASYAGHWEMCRLLVYQLACELCSVNLVQFFWFIKAVKICCLLMLHQEWASCDGFTRVDCF